MAKLKQLLALLLLLLPTACAKHEVILEDLSQRDANEVVVILRNLGVEARKMAVKDRKTTLYQILVDAREAQQALAILVANQLPKQPSLGLKQVYPPGSAGIIPTKSDEKARLYMALQGEMESMLKMLPGVVDAQVALAMDLKQGFGKDQSKRGASVTLIYQPGNEAPISDDEIKAMLAAAISELEPEEVHVIQKPLRPLNYLPGKNRAEPSLTPPADHSRNLVWASLFITALALISGAYAVARPFLQRKTKGKAADELATESTRA